MTPAPSWRQGDAVAELYVVLRHYCREHRVGHVKIAPQDVEQSDGAHPPLSIDLPAYFREVLGD